MALAAGVDVGAQSIKVVIIDGERVIACEVLVSGEEGAIASRAAFERALARSGISPNCVDWVVSTGCGRSSVSFARKQSSEVLCHARGAYFLDPSVRTIINLGAESCRAVRVGEGGRAEAFAGNDKCAAGTGLFLETMSHVLEVPLGEMGPLSLRASRKEEVSSVCAVFAESEVISHIHRGVPKDQILAGIHQAVAERALEIASRVGIVEPAMVTGGVALNPGVVEVLERKLGSKVIVPREPILVGALGAALLARELAARA